MKIKLMPAAEFEAVMKRNWTPVKLVGDALPSWMKNIPKSVLVETLASGTGVISSSQMYSSDQIPSGVLMGVIKDG